jgi:iron-sulfur cluster repair protein YtfE (RIC family)
MNATAVRAALKTVEQDHQMVLDKVQALKETVCFLLDPEDADLRRVLAQLRDSDNYFATRFLTHMEEEEAILFPLLEGDRPGGPELVERLRSEHTEIRRKREELGTCLEVASGLDNLPRAVLRDLLTYGWELWELLDNHAHVETRALHECVTRAFRGDAVAAG